MHQFEFAIAVNESSVNFKREDFYTSYLYFLMCLNITIYTLKIIIRLHIKLNTFSATVSRVFKSFCYDVYEISFKKYIIR